MMMKLKFMPVLLGAVLAFTACERHGVYDPEAAKKVTDLVVPEGFDWKMTKSARIALTSSVQTSVEVYSDKACENLLAEMSVTPQGDTCSVCVDRNASGVYIRYVQDNGATKVVPVNFVLTKSDAEDWNWGEWEIEKAKNVSGDIQSLIYYPSKKSCGTLLFEDMWPQMGDYDFNDVAAWYQIRMSSIKPPKDHEEDEIDEVKKIELAIRLNALGGQYPCELCLKFGEDSDDIRNISVETKGKGTCSWTNEGKNEDALFVFSWPELKTSQYYNTVTPVSNDELENNWVVLTIELKKDEDDNEYEDIEFEDFDFFIRRTDNNYEIHMKGYEPSDGFEKKYEELVGNKDFNLNDDDDQTYSTNDNFVWGLNVPWAINHAKENIDFGKAYDGFKEWITNSGKGNSASNWYKPNKDSENRINMINSNHSGTGYFKK